MDRQQIDELAWDVVEFARSYLPTGELNGIFITLGVGEHASAIEAVLGRLTQDAVVLPAQLAARLADWIALYESSPLYADVRRLLQRGPPLQ